MNYGQRMGYTLQTENCYVIGTIVVAVWAYTGAFWEWENSTGAMFCSGFWIPARETELTGIVCAVLRSGQKCQPLAKVFGDPHKSSLSVIVLANNERIIEY